jgi:hypothetical protein
MGIPSDRFALMVAVAVVGLVSASVGSEFGAGALLRVLGFYVILGLTLEVLERLWPDTLPEWLVVGLFWVPTIAILGATFGLWSLPLL